MNRLLRLLFDNPVLIFILFAWVAGVIGNIAKGRARARARGGASPGAAGAPTRTAPPPVQRSQAPNRTAEEVAAEMRRVLGLDPQPTSPPRRSIAPPQPPPITDRVERERPPAIMRPTAQSRHLDLHAASHVGQQMARRSVSPSTVGERDLGGLGGRVHEGPLQRTISTRYPLNDLKRMFVMMEILGRPLALREPREHS